MINYLSHRSSCQIEQSHHRTQSRCQTKQENTKKFSHARLSVRVSWSVQDVHTISFFFLSHNKFVCCFLCQLTTDRVLDSMCSDVTFRHQNTFSPNNISAVLPVALVYSRKVSVNCQLMSAGMEMIILLNRADYLCIGRVYTTYWCHYNVGDGYFGPLVQYTINKIILFFNESISFALPNLPEGR